MAPMRDVNAHVRNVSIATDMNVGINIVIVVEKELIVVIVVWKESEEYVYSRCK